VYFQELCLYGYVNNNIDTEIDPLESRVEVDEDSVEEKLIVRLQKKVDELEKRIKRLELANSE
jgi:hypothetical protein